MCGGRWPWQRSLVAAPLSAAPLAKKGAAEREAYCRECYSTCNTLPCTARACSTPAFSARRAQRVVPMGRSPGRMYFIAGRTAWALGAFVGRQACSCGVWLKWEWERTPPESSSVNGSAPLVIIYIRRDTAVTLIVLLRTCYGLWLRAHAWRSFKIIVS